MESNRHPLPAVVHSVLTSRPLLLFAGLAGFVTVVTVAAFIGIQQHLRSDANHPQLEMARAAAARLGAGASPQSVVPVGTIDLGTSTDPYLIVVDSSGALLASSAQLGAATTIPPPGVFAYVHDHGEDVITWQPAIGVRSAIVVDSYPGGFVVAGRSLRATEDQEAALGYWTLGAWIAALIAAAGIAALIRGRTSAA